MQNDNSAMEDLRNVILNVVKNLNEKLLRLYPDFKDLDSSLRSEWQI